MWCFNSGYMSIKLKNILLFCYCFGCLLFSCGLSEESEEEPFQLIPSTPNEESLRSINLEPGYRAAQLPLQNGALWNYKISIPEMEEGEKVPLIMALHWSGDNLAYREFMDCLVYPALGDKKAIIFTPSYDGVSWWEPYSANRVLSFVQWAKEVLPIDSDKVAVLGFSNGGIGSWYFAANHPEAFSAAIPMAGSYTEVRNIQMPTYIIHSPNDELFFYGQSKDYIDDLIGEGADITWIEASGLSHYEGCNYVDYLRSAGGWLETEIWK